jgi:hypothetical protein
MVNILGGHGIGHSKKEVYMNVCPIPNGFRYLARNIFLPSISMSNHNHQLTRQTLVHYGGREGKYCSPNSKYCAPNIRNRSE